MGVRTGVGRLAVAAVLLMAATLSVRGSVAQDTEQATPAVTAPEADKALVLDRVIAIVNRDILLESDLDAELRFSAFQPLTSEEEGNPRQEAMSRLIDRTLVEQQMKLRGNAPVIPAAKVEAQLMQLRQALPACAKYDCATDAGWEKFCATHGFTPAEVEERWAVRMQLLAFVEQRFRAGVRVSNVEIEDYYKQKFVPVFSEQHLTAPALDKVSDRIQEILLQEKVNLMLDGWLQSLHQQGGVKILDPTVLPEGTSRDATSSM
jgi:peptidyl-prolyl cis-trans isomerase SurA